MRDGEDSLLCGGLYLQGDRVNDLREEVAEKGDLFKQAGCREKEAPVGRQVDMLDGSNKDIKY